MFNRVGNMVEVANKFGISKSRVAQIVKEFSGNTTIPNK